MNQFVHIHKCRLLRAQCSIEVRFVEQFGLDHIRRASKSTYDFVRVCFKMAVAAVGSSIQPQ
jgi:hypothetical protein